ncbi:unnamed protein product [Adineta steineri]|uniref:RING-type domain-containing protein n=1 Tax=Adineta steineri TaxID=433720 RepID=A0A815F4L8_9BILA|nr:unnamed protein product [Adineta steineri]CAF3887348.1 unnamed protein product [Adineta steineri]
MTKRVSRTLSDEPERITKRARYFSTSSLPLTYDEERIPDVSFISTNSQNEHDNNGNIIEITNSPCQQIDNTTIIDLDDEQSIDIMINSPPSSPLSSTYIEIIDDDEEEEEEIIDLTEDEPNSSDCLSDQCEHISSFDDDELCPVCLETFSDLQYTGIYLLITQCHHVMCILCSRQILANSSQCPLCRENISTTTLKPYCILT